LERMRYLAVQGGRTGSATHPTSADVGRPNRETDVEDRGSLLVAARRMEQQLGRAAPPNAYAVSPTKLRDRPY
jgi:hypothetical protein